MKKYISHYKFFFFTHIIDKLIDNSNVILLLNEKYIIIENYSNLIIFKQFINNSLNKF